MVEERGEGTEKKSRASREILPPYTYVGIDTGSSRVSLADMLESFVVIFVQFRLSTIRKRQITQTDPRIKSFTFLPLSLQFLQNLGKVDRTADDIFDEHLQNFTRQQNSANRLQKEFNNYIRCVRGK